MPLVLAMTWLTGTTTPPLTANFNASSIVIGSSTVSEIGTVMGIDAASVRSHRRRARERLRQVLGGPAAEGR